MATPKEGTDAWYQAQYDADTLIRAQEIQADSTRMENASQILEERINATKKALDLLDTEG